MSDAAANASAAPSYARPNIAALLPDYSNAQQEAIRAAFQPNNFKTLASLHRSDMDNGPFRVGTTGGATFSDFVYISSPYDLGTEKHVEERLQHEAKMKSIGGDQPFFAGYTAAKLKHEMDIGFEYISEPYDGVKEAAARERFLSESMQVSKPFVPAGVQKALARPTRALLGDAMTALYRSITEDWPEAPPTVLSTAEDLVVVYFSLEKVKNEVGVLTYMNNALRRNEAIQEFELRKVPGAWNRRTNDGHLMFTLRPPWVKALVSVEEGGQVA